MLDIADTVFYGCVMKMWDHVHVEFRWSFTVDLREVKEIRPGKRSKDFDKWPDDARRYDSKLCFVLLYGQEFKLKSLSLVGKYKLKAHSMRYLLYFILCLRKRLRRGTFCMVTDACKSYVLKGNVLIIYYIF